MIDGDTFVIADGSTIRILNIDTAEMPPWAQCETEARLAQTAKARLEAPVRGAGVVTLAREGRDLVGLGGPCGGSLSTAGMWASC